MNDNLINCSMLNVNIQKLREASRELRVNLVKCETIEGFLFFMIELSLCI